MKQKKKKKERNQRKKINDRLITDKIIRYIRTLFEQQEDHDKPKIVSNFYNNIYIEYESNGDINRNLSLDEYLNKIKPYLRDIIIDLQISDTWKIQLTIAINFISSIDVEKEHVIHSRSDNIKFTSYNDMNKVVDKLFDLFSAIYQVNLETSMRGNDFIFDSVQKMYHKCHKLNFRRGGSHIDYPDWIKQKKPTINPKNKDDKFLQYAVMVALYYEEIKRNSEGVSNIKSFINKYKRKRINFPSKIDDWKTFKKNSPTIALNILYIKEREICPAYISKINSDCEKQIILLMIPDE